MIKHSPVPRHVLITGSSSGLGKALALRYAAPGRALSLLGRNGKALNEIAADCRDIGAKVEVAQIDVTDQMAMEKWILARDGRAPIDLVIASAGIGGQFSLASPLGEPGDTARDILNVNMIGVINTLAPFQTVMMQRGTGHLAIVSSIQCGIGLPHAPAYSASKAALKIYGDATRRLLKPAGIAVTVILPGFVETPMSASLGLPRPWLWSAERAADRIFRDIAKGRRYSVFPWQLRILTALGALTPAALVDYALSRDFRNMHKPNDGSSR